MKLFQKENAHDHYTRMTQTPVGVLIRQMAIPAIISMLVTQIYNLVDTAFVGRLGNSASGAVGVVFGLMAIIQAFGFMFGQGAGSLIARHLGAEKYDDANTIASTGFFASLTCGILITVLGLLFLHPLVLLLGSTATIAPYAQTYCAFILLSCPFMITSFFMNIALRFEGNARLGMIGLAFGGILNMIGDPIFMFVLKMGIAGAGLSTAISQIISFLILLRMFLTGKSETRIRLRSISRSPKMLLDIASTGAPSLFRQGFNSVSTLLLNNFAGLYGDAAVAAMSIVGRIIQFVISMTLGIGQGYQPVLGFNYGAGYYSRLRKAHRLTAGAMYVMITIIVALLLLFPTPLLRIFRDDPEVISIGVRALRLQAVSLLVMPFFLVIEMTYQSLGHRIGAIILSVFRTGIAFIPALIILSHLRGLAGVQEAQPLAFFITVIPTAIATLRFYRLLPKKDSPAPHPGK